MIIIMCDCCIGSKVDRRMGHFSSMFNGIAKSFLTRKGRSSGSEGREAAESMAKEAKKNETILKTSGFVNVDGSNNFASVYSKRGEKGINQDCCIVWEEFGGQPDMIFCGIFDGHGPWGHSVAKKVRESIPPSLLCSWQEALLAETVMIDEEEGDNYGVEEEKKKSQQWFSIWKNSYLRACELVDQELEQQRKFDSFYSGTTALSVVRQGEQIVIANVGDSRAVLATSDVDGSLVAVQLTLDFKPNLPLEEERIVQCNGRVFCLHDEPGIHRMWLPHVESPGLAMSRAFGDFCIKEYGLISEPQVIERDVTPSDHFIILATDGVWDVVSNQEAVEIVWNTADRAKAAKRLVEYATRAWKRKRRGYAVDDISAICFFLHSDSPSMSCSSSSDYFLHQPHHVVVPK